MGVHISFVKLVVAFSFDRSRSTQLDVWKEEQIMAMKVFGFQSVMRNSLVVMTELPKCSKSTDGQCFRM